MSMAPETKGALRTDPAGVLTQDALSSTRPDTARTPRRISAAPFVYAASILTALLAWWALARWAFPPILFPAPDAVARDLVDSLRSGQLVADIRISLVRIWSGFALGTVIAVPIGLAMGSWRPVRLVLEPYVGFLRFVPPIAFLPIAILWFGIGEASKIFLIVYTTAFVVILNTIAGVYAVSEIKIRAAQSLGIRGWSLFRRVTVPATIPYIVTGTRIAMGNSFMTVVSAEMIAADAGIGHLIFNSRITYQTGLIFVGLLALGALGLVTDWLFRRVTRRVFARYGVGRA